MDNTLDNLAKELDKISADKKDDPNIWVTQEHKEIPIKKLSDKHLLNIINRIYRTAQISIMVAIKDTDERVAAYKNWRDHVPKAWKERVKNIEAEIRKRGLTKALHK